MNRIREFFLSSPQPCPYLASKLERKLWTALEAGISPLDYSWLVRSGLRRSHHMAYRPACPNCSACVPVRIPVGHLSWSRSLRRNYRRNQDLQAILRPCKATEEQILLLRHYLDIRHHDSDMVRMTDPEYRCMIEESAPYAFMIEWWGQEEENSQSITQRHDTQTKKLYAACLVDLVEDGLSAVYSFFDPHQSRRSLGGYIILSLVKQAEQIGLPYVYLGYWIAESKKMSYKARFKPLERLADGVWQPLSS